MDKLKREKANLEKHEASLEKEEKVLEEIRDSLKGLHLDVYQNQLMSDLLPI